MKLPPPRAQLNAEDLKMKVKAPEQTTGKEPAAQQAHLNPEDLKVKPADKLNSKEPANAQQAQLTEDEKAKIKAAFKEGARKKGMNEN